jgi:hypothetical protein
MAITKNKRKEMEKLIYDVFNALDDTGTNSAKYKAFFGKMSDAQFDSFFKNFFKNENLYLILDVVDYERDIRIEHVTRN